MKVTVVVRRRPEISDPHGATVARALSDMGFAGVGRVRINKEIELEIEGDDPAEVERQVIEMCERLLANPVMDDFEVRVET